MINLTETILYGINEEEDYQGSFYVDEILTERDGTFLTKKGGNRIDIYIKEACGNEPHIHLRDHLDNIYRIRLRENKYQCDKYDKKNGHKLDKNEEKAFSEYMHRDVAGMTGFTNWHRLSANWNEVWSMNNSGTSGLVDVKKGCPAYLNIEDMK